MTKRGGPQKQLDTLRAENEQLRARLEEAEDTLRAIREGEVDAIVVSTAHGEQIVSLTEAEPIYRLIVETMKEAALTVANDGRILYCNNQFGVLVQTPAERILGRPLDAFVLPEQRTTVTSLLARSQTESVRSRLVFQGPDGPRIPAHVSASVLRQPDGVSICIVATDLSELEAATEMLRILRQQQEALQKAQEGLEARVRERTAELNKTIQTLQAEIQRRTLAEEALGRRSLQLRALTSELAIAEERERRRVGEVLHDDLQQFLIGARFHLDGLQRASEDVVRRTASDAKDLISQALHVSRSLSRELNPPILHEGGLVPAFKWLLDWMQEKHGLKAELTATGNVTPESENERIVLFHATRELLLNIIKHAGVLSASLDVSRLGKLIRIRVKDEGVGFDPALLHDEGGNARGFGLFSIRERLEALGGQLEIDSAPGKGSLFTLLAPLEFAAAERDRAASKPPLRGNEDSRKIQDDADSHPGGG